MVLDPGPDEPAHVDAILRATGGKVDLILLTHFHHDHVEATPALKQATGAPVAAFQDTRIEQFVPDRQIADDETIAGMRAVHTPVTRPTICALRWQRRTAPRCCSAAITSCPGTPPLSAHRMAICAVISAA